MKYKTKKLNSFILLCITVETGTNILLNYYLREFTGATCNTLKHIFLYAKLID